MITSVRLEGFKNFRDATLHLGPLTVIVGTNASGKSNIRDAFRFLHGMGRGYSLAEIIGEKYVEGGVLQWKGIRGGIREVAFHGESSFQVTTLMSRDSHETAKHWIDVGVRSRKTGPVVNGESLQVGDDVAFETRFSGSSPGIGSLPVWMKKNNVDDHEYFLAQSLFISTRTVLEQFRASMFSNRSDYVRCREFIESLESMRFLDLSPDAMKVPSVPGQVILGDRGENLSSVLQAICNDDDTKRAMIEWVRQLTPLDVSDFDFVPDQTGRVLLTLIESTGRRTSAYSASDGTLRFLAIIAALMGPDSAKFYFLEEIDNGIHPTRLSLLLQLIEQQTKHCGIQVVTTTHSPLMLAMLSPEARQHASLVYRLEGSTEAKITRIVDIPGANAVLETQNIGRLHESGWLENAVQFANVAETP